MNVLVVPSWYPGTSDSLLGIYHKEFTSAISKKVDANMLFINKYGIKDIFKYLFTKRKRVIKEDGYNVYIYKMLDLSKISVSLGMNMYKRALERSYKDYIKDNKVPDIIHAEVTLPAGYGCAYIGKKYNIPVIVTEHSSNYYQYFKGDNKEFGAYTIKNTLFSTVSEYMKKELSLNRCEVIPNIVDINTFNKKRYKRTPTLRLVVVAGFRNGKNLNDVIDAVNLLVKRGIDVHLDMVGDGYLMPYLKEMVDNYELNKYVTFLGRKTKEEVAEILSCNDIYIIASDTETFCIPGIEALASGTVIVSTRCKGPEEYIDSSCGKFYKTHDIEDMCDKIIEVYKSLDKYDLKHLRSVAEKYSMDNVSNKAISIYESMLKDKNKAH